MLPLSVFFLLSIMLSVFIHVAVIIKFATSYCLELFCCVYPCSSSYLCCLQSWALKNKAVRSIGACVFVCIYVCILLSESGRISPSHGKHLLNYLGSYLSSHTVWHLHRQCQLLCVLTRARYCQLLISAVVLGLEWF